MTWNELKEKAKEMGYKLVVKIPCERKQQRLVNDKGYAFYRDGTCEYETSMDDELCGRPFAYDRSIKQMLMIMRGLE